jgi:predicted Zn-dependent peptidase
MYRKTVLNNGVRLLSEKLDHMRSISLGIWVDVGSRDEDRSENGISHFLEHMIFKGTRRRDSHEIAKELDAIGGLSNAFTGKETTCFHGRVLAKHLTLLEDILSDIFLNSVFDPADMERERQVILQEINMVEDTPDDNIHVLFNRLVWMDHPIGMSVLGTGETVSAIRQENILNYIKRFYVPEGIIVVAAGNVDHDALVSYFRPLFESLERRRTPYLRTVPHANAGVSLQFKDLEQVHLCVGGEAPCQSSEKRFAAAILNTVLGGNMSSRLFQEIREKRGLAYAVYSFMSAYVDTGILGIYAATDSRNVNPVLDIIQAEVSKICRGGLSDSELSTAKEHLIGGVYLASESADNRMMRLAKNEFVFERYVPYDELVSRLEQVTAAEVVEVATDTFRNSPVSFASLGPLSEKNLDQSHLTFDI